jgi:hypothetical protein
VIGNTAHRHAVALGQCDVQQDRGLLCVFKEQFIEVAEPEQQERICRDAASEPPVLLHHWSESVGHDFRIKSARANCEFGMWIGKNSFSAGGVRLQCGRPV